MNTFTTCETCVVKYLTCKAISQRIHSYHVYPTRAYLQRFFHVPRTFLNALRLITYLRKAARTMLSQSSTGFKTSLVADKDFSLARRVSVKICIPRRTRNQSKHFLVVRSIRVATEGANNIYSVANLSANFSYLRFSRDVSLAAAWKALSNRLITFNRSICFPLSTRKFRARWNTGDPRAERSPNTAGQCISIFTISLFWTALHRFCEQQVYGVTLNRNFSRLFLVSPFQFHWFCASELRKMLDH